jgi:hypothetical protein
MDGPLCGEAVMHNNDATIDGFLHVCLETVHVCRIARQRVAAPRQTPRQGRLQSRPGASIHRRPCIADARFEHARESRERGAAGGQDRGDPIRTDICGQVEMCSILVFLKARRRNGAFCVLSHGKATGCLDETSHFCSASPRLLPLVPARGAADAPAG